LNGERGYGLLGVQERLETVGGSMDVHGEPGVGTRLLVRVPKELVARAPSGSAGELVRA
jgi:signal transduction histidine kinase